MKPFFTDKSKTCNKIILNENDKTIKDGKEIANKFDNFFSNIIKKVNLKKDAGTLFNSQESCRMIKMKQLRIYLQARHVFQMIIICLTP